MTQWYPVVSDVPGKCFYSILGSSDDGTKQYIDIPEGNDSDVVLDLPEGTYQVKCKFVTSKPGYEIVNLFSKIEIIKATPSLDIPDTRYDIYIGDTLPHEIFKAQVFVTKGKKKIEITDKKQKIKS